MRGPLQHGRFGPRKQPANCPLTYAPLENPRLLEVLRLRPCFPAPLRMTSFFRRSRSVSRVVLSLLCLFVAIRFGGGWGLPPAGGGVHGGEHVDDGLLEAGEDGA